jgi:hypothetical protein
MAHILQHRATFTPDVPGRVFWAGAIGALLVLSAAWYASVGGIPALPAFDPALLNPPMLPIVPLL